MDREPVRILLVEDTEDHVELICHALRSGSLPTELSVAGTLQEARVHLARSTPDLLILDLQLPDGQGMELFPSDGTQLPFPVIVSTAHGEQRDAVEAMKAGAMDYVVKSSDTLVEMHRVVERTLQQWGHIVDRQKAEAALQKAHDELETRVGQRTAELTAVNQRLREEIEERKRVEHQAQQRLAELAHVGRLNTMGGMIAELAHEINQPLFAISNYASACQERLAARGDEDLGPIPDWLEKISRQACRTGEIIRRLNRFIRKTQPQQSTANINDLVANVVELMESTARLYRVEIQLRFGGSLPSLLMDRIQIEQVIANLVQNAIDAMRETPTERRSLTVETSLSENNEIHVAVRDSGKGITQEELDRVFDAFYTTKDDGMGMGLAICRSIVEDHDGRLQATRNPDHGTTFSFTLPVRMQQEPGYVRQDDRVYRG